MHGQPRPQSEIERVLSLASTGLSDYEVARRTGVPRSTVQHWRRGHVPRNPGSKEPPCLRCGAPEHDFRSLTRHSYAYLLGQYLGDGTLFRAGKTGHVLQIASDAQYPGIIAETCQAIEEVRGKRPYVRHLRDKRMARILSYWRAWPCLFPQHGPGRKHHRQIALLDWQLQIVDAEPGSFLRGLIHSDGWRGQNRVRVKGRDYAYPRYQFSNRSAEIKELFTDACDRLGIAWRPWGKHHISVARRDAVRTLDRFVGPKT
jgi:hypothetical protein